MLKRIEKCFSYTSNVSLLLLFFLFFSHCKIERTLPLPHLIPRAASNLAYPFKFAPQQPVQSPHACLKVHFLAHGKLENLHQPSQNWPPGFSWPGVSAQLSHARHALNSHFVAQARLSPSHHGWQAKACVGDFVGSCVGYICILFCLKNSKEIRQKTLLWCHWEFRKGRHF